MKTKHFIMDLFAAMAPGFFVLVVPLYLAGTFLPLPFNAIAYAAILAIGGLIIHFRVQIDAWRAAWRSNRKSSYTTGRGFLR